MKLPLVDAVFEIQKKEGKGDWTFVEIAGIPKSAKDKIGLVRVSGKIDTYELKQFYLLPMKNGNMLLSLKTVVRKKIGKKEGDSVHVVLFSDDSPVVVPDDLLVCLLDSEKAYQYFLALSESNKKHYIDWVEESKKMETKIDRIAKMIERLEKGLRFYDW